MSATVQEDSLHQEAQTAIAEATRLGFVPYFSDDLSWLWEEEKPGTRSLIRWDIDRGSWREFLQVGKNLGAQALYIEVATFNFEESVGALLQDLTEEGVAGELDQDQNRLLKEAEQYKRYEGQVQDLVLAYQAASIWHVYHRPAGWVSQYQALISGLEEVEEVDEEESDLLEEELERYGRQLAQYPPFGRTEKKTVRREIARRLFKDRLEELEPHIEEIVETAVGIFETDIRPTKEKTLAEEAHRLIKSGITRRKVAERLNLSWQRLNRLLLDFPREET